MLAMVSGSGCRRKRLAAFQLSWRVSCLDWKSAEPLQLLLADAQILVACAFSFRLVKVQQGIVGGIGYGDKGFQFVGGAVGKVAFHLLQRLFAADGADKYPEREAEDDEGITNEVVRMPDICFSTNG